jgi:hypothetical protein
MATLRAVRDDFPDRLAVYLEWFFDEDLESLCPIDDLFYEDELPVVDDITDRLVVAQNQHNEERTT